MFMTEWIGSPVFSAAAFICSASPWSRVVGHSIRAKPQSLAS